MHLQVIKAEKHRTYLLIIWIIARREHNRNTAASGFDVTSEWMQEDRTLTSVFDYTPLGDPGKD